MFERPPTHFCAWPAIGLCLTLACGGSNSRDVSSVTPPPRTSPRIQDLAPASIYHGTTSGPLALTLTGMGFKPGAIIQLKGASRPTTYVSETVLTTTLTVDDLAMPGALTVAVSMDGMTTPSRSFRILPVEFGSSIISTPDWTPATHGKLKAADIIRNMPTVFNEQVVQRMDIRISLPNWMTMQNDLQILRSDLRTGPTGMPDFTAVSDPIYVPCTVTYGGKNWYQVGLRFKGNSSLYHAGNQKLPIKLKFNEFESVYPAITGQRFYGFKTFSLKNNYRDESETHEVTASRLFRDFGLKAAHTSFYKLYVDSGNGPTYFGLYTLVEEVDDTVLKTQYDTDAGNLYKPEGLAATFKSGTFNAYEYGKKNNEDKADYTDMQQLLDAVNSPLRTSDRLAWKASLEAILDVPLFLKWLAANTVMQNWDSYGVSPQNYLLYRNPSSSRFEWIPWDASESFVADPKCLPLSMTAAEVSNDWPLIRYLLDDAAYMAQYRQNIHDFSFDLFNATRMVPIYDAQEALVRSAVLEETLNFTFTSGAKFSAAIMAMKAHVAAREAAAKAF